MSSGKISRLVNLLVDINMDREKYEKKVEKLMMFIFSVAHNQDNQLGPSEGRKMLTNAGISINYH